MKNSSILPLVVTLALCASPAGATTHNVQPGDTIQTVIGAASSGDTILVAAGTYTGVGNRELNFGGKQLVMLSEQGPQFTFIDVEGVPFTSPRRGMTFDHGEDETSRVEGFTFLRAVGDMYGGAILCQGSGPTIANCVFDSGYANLGGPGVGCTAGASPRINDCVFRGGMTDYHGGGITCIGSSPQVRGCVFEGNGSPYGGAVNCEGAASIPVFDECLFVANDAIGGGVAHVASDAHPIFRNCTFYANSASNGSGFYVWEATATIENTVIAFGIDGSGDGVVSCDLETAVPQFTCSDLYGNAGGDWGGCIASQAGTGGNFSADPIFCDTAAGDFHPQEHSPCAPDSNSCGIRIGALDPGCGGYSGPYWYVSTAGDDVSGDGSYANPWATIQHAIDQAPEGDSVLVLAGTFSGPGNRDIDFKNKTLSVATQYGADSTFIDCDSLQGFIFDGTEDSTSRIAGFTIYEAAEEAIWCEAGVSPLIEDCVFTDGLRGVTCRDSASPVLRRCIFRDNYFPDGYQGGGVGVGAGLYCTAGLDTTRVPRPVLDSCVFEGNQASAGAAIYCWFGTPVVTHTLFLRNGLPDTTSVGAGVFVSDGEGPTLTRCTFVENLASNGSAVKVQLNGWATLDQCILAFNQVGSAMGNLVSCDHSGYVNITCSDIYGNSHGDFTDCIAGLNGVDGNFSAEPIFCDVPGDDFRLRGHSPCQPGHPLNSCDEYIGAYDVECLGPVWVVCPTGCDLTGDGSFAHPWLTIETGVNQAPVGDTVLLLPGTYTGVGNRSIDFQGKGIVVTSYWGADSTVVDMGNWAYGFLFDDGEDSTCIIRDLTFRGASNAAIRCDSATPVVTECVFTFNNISIDCWAGSDLHVADCDFVSNVNAGGNASGIACHFSAPIVERCYFEGNASPSGGAVYVSGNTATPVFTDCLFVRNGRDLYQTSLGAAMAVYFNAHPVVQNCTFLGNMAVWGSAIHTQDGDVTITNSIIAFNYDGGTGHPVFCLGAGDAIDISCSDVFGNEGGDFEGCLAGEESQNGNFSANPLFCDTAGGDFHLAVNSLCAAANNVCATLMGALDTACAALSNTAAGSNVIVSPGEGVTVTYDQVTGDGQTDVIRQTGGPVPPGVLATLPSDPTTYYNITTTSTYTGNIQICVSYDEADLEGSEHELTLQHYTDGSGWADITTSHDMINDVICGVTTTLSPFVVAQDTAGNAAPTAHRRILPLDSATVTPPTVDFVWSSCFDPDGDPITYLLNVNVLTVDTTIAVTDTTFALEVDSLGLPGGNWNVAWSVRATDGSDTATAVNDPGVFRLDVSTNIASDEPVLPLEYALDQNFPNPFNSGTEIRFALPEPVRVELVMFNVLGQRVATLVSGSLPAGFHRVIWDGRTAGGGEAGSGVYFYRLDAGSYHATKVMTLLR